MRKISEKEEMITNYSLFDADTQLKEAQSCIQFSEMKKAKEILNQIIVSSIDLLFENEIEAIDKVCSALEFLKIVSNKEGDLLRGVEYNNIKKKLQIQYNLFKELEENHSQGEDFMLQKKILSEQSIKIIKQDYHSVFNGYHLDMSKPNESMSVILKSIKNQKQHSINRMVDSINKSNEDIQTQQKSDPNYHFMNFIYDHPCYFSIAVIILVFFIVVVIAWFFLRERESPQRKELVRQLKSYLD